ncbi:hypothetical protein IHV25_05320 [Phaeovibrio sulfidiphilus]|uniref:Uncharacterized protein n=1 Tax=Phaeovibrio sulfidiphilus TaxID=1220600 RepID=A0A8J6YVB3_9PROT|nr:hypothetical protein [Phaeovibrio sulfidiphilus]MBE1237064.1 hypothetical protein [Phaeovibrio sulfidiphilus]
MMLKIIQSNPDGRPTPSRIDACERPENRRYSRTGEPAPFPVLAKSLRTRRDEQAHRRARAQRRRWALLVGSAALFLVAAGLMTSLWALIRPIVTSPFYPS